MAIRSRLRNTLDASPSHTDGAGKVRGLERTGRPFGGILADARRRGPWYLSDWVDGLHYKTLSATLFMFFATFASTVALGELARTATDNHVGVTEYLFLQGACGMIHTLLSGQPLLILRPTGPITLFMTKLYTLAHKFEFEYFSWLAWVGFFVGGYMLLVSLFDLSSLIRHLTRFLHDLYSCFVCTIYIWDGINGVLQRFKSSARSRGDAFFDAVLAAITIAVGLFLMETATKRILTRTLRKLVVDYALAIAVAVAIWVSYMLTDEFHVERIPMPAHFGPTFVLPVDNTTHTGGQQRSWRSSISFDKQWMPAAAAVAAIPIVFLFYIDQNISALLCQTPSMRLRKGCYFHSSFFLVAVFNAVFPLFGLPFVTASLPHSPAFTRALADTNKAGQVLRVHENRVAPMLMYGLCFGSLFFPRALEVIPEGVVNGILTFVGLAGILRANQFVERIALLVTDPADFPKDAEYSNLRPARIHLYTFCQLFCLAGCWIVNQTPAGLFFPVFIVFFVIPFRAVIMKRIFSEEELAGLDSEDVSLLGGDLADDDSRDDSGHGDLLRFGSSGSTKPLDETSRLLAGPLNS